jgi:hypothetical protein
MKVYFIYQYLRFFDPIIIARNDIAAHAKVDTAKFESCRYLMYELLTNKHTIGEKAVCFFRFGNFVNGGFAFSAVLGIMP